MSKEPRTVSVETMRKSDAYTIEHFVPSKELMRRAGQGIYDSVCDFFDDGWQEPVAIACGKGNNAGDGYVVANLLHNAGIDCTIILVEADRFSEDGKYYFDICVNNNVPVEIFDSSCSLDRYNTILDALLGTGFKGKVRGNTAEIIKAINERSAKGARVISADINSGLNGDTGLCGDSGLCEDAILDSKTNLDSSPQSVYVKSDLTVSIGTFKHGHFKGLADIAMKNKVNCDIGIQIIE